MSMIPPYVTLDDIVDYLSELDVDEPANLTQLLNHFQLSNANEKIILMYHSFKLLNPLTIKLNTILIESNIYDGETIKNSVKLALQLAIKNHDKLTIAQLSQFLKLSKLTKDYLFFDREIPQLVNNGQLWNMLSLY